MDIGTNQSGELTLSYETLDHFHQPWPCSTPTYATPGAACIDLPAAIRSTLAIRPGERALVPTGLKFKIPAGYELQVRSRSGLSYKSGIVVLNAPGTIDEDYQGELKVILINTGHETFVLGRNNRIAQIALQEVTKARIVENVTGDLFGETTTRGDGGFGSTGN